MTRDSMEGFLFPALYEFTQRTTARELVADQLRAFRERFRTVDLAYARSKNLTPYDVLIIASMIEKETAVPRERRLVSAVIYNRLRNRMPLGIDATVRYGLDIPGTESLTKQALRSNSPYNTRLRTGAPADADREPWPRIDPCRRESRAGGGLPLLRPQAQIDGALLHGGRDRLPAQGLRVRVRLRLKPAEPDRRIRERGRSRNASAGGAEPLRVRRERLALHPDMLSCAPEHILEELSERACIVDVGIDPDRREQLSPDALVLAARLEPGEKPSIDVVDTHRDPYRHLCAPG